LIGRALPDTTTIASALAINCYLPTAASSPFVIGAAALDAGQIALTNYYRHINTRDYISAYATWLHPLPGPKPNGAPAEDYRTPYSDFVAGYSDTLYVFGYYGPYNESGAFSGHGYVDGMIPTVLIGLHTDGSVTSYYGCYVLGFQASNPPSASPVPLGIISGTFNPITTPYVPNGNVIRGYLGLDCTTLSLKF